MYVKDTHGFFLFFFSFSQKDGLIEKKLSSCGVCQTSCSLRLVCTEGEREGERERDKYYLRTID